MTRVASLGMYDGPALYAANDELWRLIARRLEARGLAGVPAALDRTRPLEAIWRDPGLLLAQCCGYPLVARYRTVLRYVATPCYTAPGCAGADYRSRIVVRDDDPAETLSDLRGRRAAVNEWLSNSGMNMFRSAIAPLAEGQPFFAAVVATGSHAASLAAVADGTVDVAAIDAVTYAHVARQRPAPTAGLRTIGWTEASPGLPFVTGVATSEAELRTLREVLDEVMRDPAARVVRDALLLDRTEWLPAGAYDRLLRIEDAAVRQGYPDLA